MSKLHKENNRNNKSVSTFFIFYLLFSSFFFSDFTFYKELLCFIRFILSLCSNTWTLESIFQCIRQKLKKTCSLQNFIPGWIVYTPFFLFFHPGVKFHPCLFESSFICNRDEISSRIKKIYVYTSISSRDETSRISSLGET